MNMKQVVLLAASIGVLSGCSENGEVTGQAPTADQGQVQSVKIQEKVADPVLDTEQKNEVVESESLEVTTSADVKEVQRKNDISPEELDKEIEGLVNNIQAHQLADISPEKLKEEIKDVIKQIEAENGASQASNY